MLLHAIPITPSLYHHFALHSCSHTPTLTRPHSHSISFLLLTSELSQNCCFVFNTYSRNMQQNTEFCKKVSTLDDRIPSEFPPVADQQKHSTISAKGIERRVMLVSLYVMQVLSYIPSPMNNVVYGKYEKSYMYKLSIFGRYASDLNIVQSGGGGG